jgi:nucleoside-diphosphate-sugar epimerase
VIGRPLAPLLIAAGYAVAGATRSAEKAAALKTIGAEPIVVDVFDAVALRDAVLGARPQVVIHQFTDLPDAIDPAQMPDVLARNSRLRIEGTANLIAAARAAGAGRLIAQSIAFAYAEGPEPHAESDPLASAEGDGPGAVTARGLRALEDAVLNTPGVDGIVLRYGRLYGPGTWNTPNARAPLHVDAAAHAALLAVTHGRPGVYNIAEDDGAVSIEKARKELNFDPGFRVPA